MKKYKKIIMAMILCVVTLFIIQNSVFAQIDTNQYKPGPINEGDNYYVVAGKILEIVTNVGIIVATIALVIIGIQTMLGSIEEKAKYKEKVLPYVIGAVLICSVSIVVKVLVSLGNSL